MATSTINARQKLIVHCNEAQCLVVTSQANSSGNVYKKGTGSNPADTAGTTAVGASANFIIPPVQGGADYIIVCDAGSITVSDPSYVSTFVVSATAPSNSDGRPDGTLYFQTA